MVKVIHLFCSEEEKRELDRIKERYTEVLEEIKGRKLEKKEKPTWKDIMFLSKKVVKYD